MRYSQLDAKNIWDKIPKKCKHGVKTAPRDFVALECLANDSLYAKPDSMKMFLLWEVKRNGVKIETSPNLSSKHPWVYKLFIQSQFVRFPFNTWDTEIGDSLSWATVRQNLLPNNFHERFSILPRWSTASRSSLALIPENANKLPVIVPGAVDLGERKRLQNNAYVNVPEWKDCETKRFCSVVGQVGDAAGKMGIRLQPYSENSACRYRLYSIKTGVTYVGSKNEGGFGKNRLEANCSMAMLRSKVIDSLPNKDNTFGVQTEILTITAPLAAGGQDGFQVRDLSCMWKTLSYVPCQSIPYAREGVDHAASNKAQSDFWRSRLPF